MKDQGHRWQSDRGDSSRKLCRVDAPVPVFVQLEQAPMISRDESDIIKRTNVRRASRPRGINFEVLDVFGSAKFFQIGYKFQRAFPRNLQDVRERTRDGTIHLWHGRVEVRRNPGSGEGTPRGDG